MDASETIDRYIADLVDWRGETLAIVRKTILGAAPGIVEEWKWMGTPTWSQDGVLAIANAHKDKVKVTFAQGAELPDPDKIFNAGLGGNRWRAIDLYEGDMVNKRALTNMVVAAVAFNGVRKKGKARSGARRARPNAGKK